ncbi:hypothetical protein [Candidatus Nanohalobium constans]|uniref:Uncharacterized protein n=1 Tax=Candidatus Nanohalobium constans TaxID=2565781 RepID=A0A5Q0UGM3_9ARCH|nr:hypothetical protein [Candidatus Nanohalobium constans]QGA80105.1 hypothetical protein LC1Nh_0200 [Candidatus Nanohalobium constans]
MNLEFSDNVRKDVFYLGVCAVLVVSAAALNNYYTPDDPLKVGYTEVETNCIGMDVGVCLGVQKQDHTTYNYDNYTEVEPGTENFYRRVESELMMQAYNICDADMSGMEWTDQAEYRNQTGTEWLENENVSLLKCEQTFHRNITASR